MSKLCTGDKVYLICLLVSDQTHTLTHTDTHTHTHAHRLQYIPVWPYLTHTHTHTHTDAAIVRRAERSSILASLSPSLLLPPSLSLLLPLSPSPSISISYTHPLHTLSQTL